jgi:Phage tail assembly chaperone protein
MEAVVDPSGLTVVGTVLPNACRHGGPWADFVTVPIPDELKDKPLKVSLVDDAYVLSVDTDTVTEAAWSQLRSQRDSLLAASDWRVLPYSPLTSEEQAAWVTYRQALRDLPGSVQDPLNPVWPSPPSSP